MKRLFTVLLLTFLLTLIPSHFANAFSELSEAKCNKKCQEEKKANKSTCKQYTVASKNFVRSVGGTSATRQFDKDEILNISATLISKVSPKTRDDLEVYVKEFAYWVNFYGTNVLPENATNKINALREILNRMPRIDTICQTQ